MLLDPSPQSHTPPPFEPHPRLRTGHHQTIAARFLPGRRVRLHSRYVELALVDGDRLALLDAAPPDWRSGDPVCLLVHGLGGCARAPYVARIADRLHRAGVRSVRMNLRGAGVGFGLARGIYHAGRTEDLRAVARWIDTRAPGSPLALLGLSLGANLVLKLAAEAATDPIDNLDCVVACNPPLDLSACCRHISTPRNRIYDKNFVAGLRAQIQRLHSRFPDLPPFDASRVGSLYAFDDQYTAPRNGFAGAEDYYRRSSAGPLLTKIQVDGLLIHADDDPFIPAESVRSAIAPPNLKCEILAHGGHLGYISREPWAGDRRWLDARVTHWLMSRWSRRPDQATPFEKKMDRAAHLLVSSSLEGDIGTHVQ